MSKKKKRRENARKKQEKALTAAGFGDESQSNSKKISHEGDFPKCNSESDHVWGRPHESENHTEITRFCKNCYDKKTEKQIFNHFKPTLLPHEMIKHGPSERRVKPREYTAPLEPKKLIGDLIQKSLIFNRCLENGIVERKNITGLEEKSKIVNSIIPEIIIDECVASLKILEKIQECGYDVQYLGKGLSDDKINEIVEQQKAVLVTEDEEFHNKVFDDKTTFEPIFIRRNKDRVIENIVIIKKHMRRFERNNPK